MVLYRYVAACRLAVSPKIVQLKCEGDSLWFPLSALPVANRRTAPSSSRVSGGNSNRRNSTNRSQYSSRLKRGDVAATLSCICKSVLWKKKLFWFDAECKLPGIETTDALSRNCSAQQASLGRDLQYEFMQQGRMEIAIVTKKCRVQQLARVRGTAAHAALGVYMKAYIDHQEGKLLWAQLEFGRQAGRQTTK